MNRRLLCAALLAATFNAHAEPWTYRGTLNDGGQPANGTYDLRVTLLTAKGDAALTRPLTLYGIEVKAGRFAADVDFGIDMASAPAMRLKTEVAQGGAEFVALGEATRFDPKAALGGVCWDTEGNAGTNPSINFIGTTDNQPLVLRTFNTNSVQIVPIVSNGAPTTTLLASNVVVGSFNSVFAGIAGATISGGGSNPTPTNPYTTFTGLAARGNTVTSDFATVAGGYDNEAGATQNSLGRFSTVSGGVANRAGSFGTVVSGGSKNTASGSSSTIPGGSRNCAGGANSLAAGRRAKIRPASDPGGTNDACAGLAPYPGGNGDQGTFVWADSQDSDFVSSGLNQFLVRAQGGFGLGMPPYDANIEMTIRGRNTAGAAQNADIALVPNDDTNSIADNEGILISAIDAVGTNNVGLRIAHSTPTAVNERLLLSSSGLVNIRSNITGTNSGVTMAAGAGAWSSLSDRNVKTAIAAVNPIDVLERLAAMPMSSWQYMTQTAQTRHLGPMAQDFYAAFGLGESDKMISTVDADGVALAAIQGLHQKVLNENAALKAELAELTERLQQLESARR